MMKFVIRKILWMICYIIFWEIARVTMGAGNHLAMSFNRAIALVVGVAVLSVLYYVVRKSRIPAVISSAVQKLRENILK